MINSIMDIELDYYESTKIVSDLFDHIHKNNIKTVFVSSRLFDVLKMYYYVSDFTYIYDPKKHYYEYGFERSLNNKSDVKTFFDIDD